MNWKDAGILFVVLVVPIILILVFKTGTTKLVNLPIYGEKVFVDGDSLDYKIELSQLVTLEKKLKGKHILLYLSENVKNSLYNDAKENIDKIALRLENAKNHPINPVSDIVFLSVIESEPEADTLETFFKRKSLMSIPKFIEEQLQNSFGFSNAPLNDHVIFLIDKDMRVRSMYFSAHGKFDRNILGELVVLQTEYGSSQSN